MTKAISINSVCPVRKEPSDCSEMTSQLLFGELCQILDTHKQWNKIKIENDGYEGWLDSKQIIHIEEEKYQDYKENTSYMREIFNFIIKDNFHIIVPIGSEIHTITDNTFEINSSNKFSLEDPIESSKLNKTDIIPIAMKYINTPYIWGGKSSFGIDCSGLTQMVYKIIGTKIPRDAYQQAEIGEVLGFIEEAEKGDLAFFENEEKKIIHVGIYLGNGNILHAHGRVRIDNLDSNGIYNIETKKYTHKLRFIRKIL